MTSLFRNYIYLDAAYLYFGGFILKFSNRTSKFEYRTTKNTVLISDSDHVERSELKL